MKAECDKALSTVAFKSILRRYSMFRSDAGEWQVNPAEYSDAHEGDDESDEESDEDSEGDDEAENVEEDDEDDDDICGCCCEGCGGGGYYE